jgi:hypothetical protein
MDGNGTGLARQAVSEILMILGGRALMRTLQGSEAAASNVFAVAKLYLATKTMLNRGNSHRDPTLRYKRGRVTAGFKRTYAVSSIVHFCLHRKRTFICKT